MGRWLTALREREKSQTAQTGTDKTDKTAGDEVLSVLSVPVGRVCEKSELELAGGFVGAPCGSAQELQPSPTPPDVSPEDWRAFFEERAGIAEFEGGLARPQAEVRAFAYCVAEWLHRNPVRSEPGQCLSCGAGESTRDPLLPFGAEASGHVWLHSRCWPAWYESRRGVAVAVLRALGITAPAGSPNRVEAHHELRS